MLLVCKDLELFGYPARKGNRLANTLRQFRFVSRALQIIGRPPNVDVFVYFGLT